jgi:hypothetical protein
MVPPSEMLTEHCVAQVQRLYCRSSEASAHSGVVHARALSGPLGAARQDASESRNLSAIEQALSALEQALAAC